MGSWIAVIQQSLVNLCIGKQVHWPAPTREVAVDQSSDSQSHPIPSDRLYHRVLYLALGHEDLGLLFLLTQTLYDCSRYSLQD
jgi:hypothetical protein